MGALELTLTIFISIIGGILLLFFLYLLLGNMIFNSILGKKSLAKIRVKHASDANNPFLKQTDFDWCNNYPHTKETTVSFDHLKLYSFLYMSSTSSHTYIIGMHGWGGSYVEQTVLFKHLQDKYNINVLLVCARANENSEGNFSTMGEFESKDLISWGNYILSKDKDAKIILFGESMGAASVLLAGSYVLPKEFIGLISDSSYTSALTEFGLVIKKSHIPYCISVFPAYIAGKLFHKINLSEANPINKVKKIITPTLLIHSIEDKFIPPHDMDLLYDNFNKETCDVTKYMFPKGGHCLACSNNTESYFALVDNFIEKISK